MERKKKAIIAGAGPAGLTAALEFLRRTDIDPIVYEESGTIGGISRTVNYKGNRMDIGGHRFFSKSQRVTDFWDKLMPLQGAPSIDDKLTGAEKAFVKGGPDPEKTDRVMLLRHRVSRIFFLKKFFDYPISLKLKTFTNMGLRRTLEAGLGYIRSLLHKLPETSLENFYINRFGRKLYSMFFEDYTEKVWGVHPSKLGADWGSQRVKGLSIWAIVKDMVRKALNIKDKGHTETSLIESFVYPKLGPGQLWELAAREVEKLGGRVVMNTKVSGVHVKDGKIDYVETTDGKGNTEKVFCDYFLSSMPIKDLVACLDGIGVPNDVREIASTLPYRDFITVGVLVKRLKVGNETKWKTYKNRIPDTWIYVQERDVRVGRLQVFNNWSPYLVKDYENTMWIGMEYFCNEGDEMWTMDKQKFIGKAVGELEHIGFIDHSDVLDTTQIKVRKAYPSYFGSYYQLDKVRAFLDGITNLFCIGRNGQHRYNNMDHSMLTAMEAVDAIKAGTSDKTKIWSVNTEEEYHESK